jgi:hypothetical protein
MRYEAVKVFTSTKARDRNSMGEVMTAWLRTKRPEIVDKVVLLSSDREFHCFSIVVFYNHS